MFGILFGWRKAHKCKKQIKRLQCRLKLLKSKRFFFVRQLRDEVAELVKLGHKESALSRAEQLFKDETMLTAYELIDYFCDYILIHMHYISSNKNRPDHINEAVSSLIFASARCVDLPELWDVRKLFVHRYGQRFAIAAVELYPGNLVNLQIKEKLMIQQVTEDIKSRLVNEIAREHCPQSEIIEIEYAIEPEQRQSYQGLDKDSEGLKVVPRAQASDLTAFEEKTIDIDLQPNGSSTLTPCHSMQSEDEELNCKELEDMYKSRIIRQYTKYRHTTVSKAYCSCLEQKIEKISLVSSPGILPQLLDRALFSLDIEEHQSYMLDVGDCQDKRVFKFRSSIPLNYENYAESEEQSCTNQNQLGFEKLSSRLV